MPDHLELGLSFGSLKLVVLLAHQSADIPTEDHLLLSVTNSKKLLNCDGWLVIEFGDQQFVD